VIVDTGELTLVTVIFEIGVPTLFTLIVVIEIYLL